MIYVVYRYFIFASLMLFLTEKKAEFISIMLRSSALLLSVRELWIFLFLIIKSD